MSIKFDPFNVLSVPIPTNMQSMNESTVYKVTVYPIDFKEPTVEYHISMPANEVVTINDMRDMISEDLNSEFPDQKEDPKPHFVITKDEVI